ncbi:MAG: PH domain-containing protein [Planctomycetota bacterium]
MSEIQDSLAKGERIRFTTGIHPTASLQFPIWTLVLTGSVLVLAIIMKEEPRYEGDKGASLFPYWMLTIMATIVTVIWSYARHAGTEYAITNKRVILSRGIFNTQMDEIRLAKIEGVSIRQGMFEYGCVVVSGTGGKTTELPGIPNPKKFRMILEERISALEEQVKNTEPEMARA